MSVGHGNGGGRRDASGKRTPWNNNRRPGSGRQSRPWLWLAVVGGMIGLVWLLLAAFPQCNLQSAD